MICLFAMLDRIRAFNAIMDISIEQMEFSKPKSFIVSKVMTHTALLGIWKSVLPKKGNKWSLRKTRYPKKENTLPRFPGTNFQLKII